MGDSIKSAFSRMNLHQIRAFALYGAEQKSHSNETHKDRLENATAPLHNRMNSLYTVQSELTEATNDIAKALSAFEEVYMEIGMKMGARLIYQLLVETEQSKQ